MSLKKLALPTVLCIVSFGAGMVVVGFAFPQSVPTRESDEWTADEYLGELEGDLRLCRAYYGVMDLPAVTKANALRAAEFLQARRTTWKRSIVVEALVTGTGGEDGDLYLPAVELGQHRKQVVFAFQADDPNTGEHRLARVAYDLSPYYDMSAMGGVRALWTPVPRADLLRMGKGQADGTILISNPRLAEHADWIMVPDGEVAVGLRYADGSYSNFVPLTRKRGM
jgi:hypothetical protein